MASVGCSSGQCARWAAHPLVMVLAPCGSAMATTCATLWGPGGGCTPGGGREANETWEGARPKLFLKSCDPIGVLPCCLWN